jgi:Ca-activated chloride channel family protein
MQRLWLTGRILAAGGRLTVQHVFRSDEPKPLEVIYSFALPRDAALRGFRVLGQDFEAHSELKQTEEALKAYEAGVAAGSLSTLMRQYGDGIINLTVGNIRPDETVTVYIDVLAGTELRDDGFRFRFPFTLAPAYHPRMRAAVVSPGEGELELPPAEFGDVILPRFREDASSLHEIGFDVSVLHGLPVDEIGSPSHAIRVKHESPDKARVALAPEKDVPDRDLVLDVRFRENTAQVVGGPARNGKPCFAAVLPSTLFGAKPDTPRRTVIVLDRSGSMQGAPILQARKAAEVCLAALAEEDSFGLVAFDNQVESLNASLLTGNREHRDKAREFLNKLDARGGTELAAGILEAARILGGSGDVLVITDGQVSGTEEILAKARAANIRLFCLGIGSASQDRFLSLLARETGGVSRFLTVNDRVDLAAVDLFASIGRPVAGGLKAGADVQPEPPSAVFAGTPVLLFAESAGDSLEVSWDGGSLSLPVPQGDEECGETVRLLQGARLITDWESRYPSEEALSPLENRKQNRIAARLVDLSEAYGLASREMSFVAVVKRAGDRAGELPNTVVVPVGMPRDTKFGAYFGSTGVFMTQFAAPGMPAPTSIASDVLSVSSRFELGAMADVPPARLLSRLFRARREPEKISNDDKLLDLAAQLEPDGGMPGDTATERTVHTIAAVFALVSDGNTVNRGAFRTHLARMVKFLATLRWGFDSERSLIENAIRVASTGNAPLGDWVSLASVAGVQWSDLEQAMGG